MSAKKSQPEEEVPELLTWDPADGTEDDEEVDDELPADEAFAGDELDEAEAPPLAAKEADDFGKQQPKGLPQPERARSHPDLPKVTTSSFKRLIR